MVTARLVIRSTAGLNVTGPGLADVVGRKAGSPAGFHRYSDALERSGIVWSEQTPDAWVANFAALVPGNDRRFQGIGDTQTRNNLVAEIGATIESECS